MNQTQPEGTQQKPEGTQHKPEGKGETNRRNTTRQTWRYEDRDYKTLNSIKYTRDQKEQPPPSPQRGRQLDAWRRGAGGEKGRREGNRAYQHRHDNDKSYSDGRRNSVWRRTPPSGEPGEPRWPEATLRTPSSKPGSLDKDRKQNISRNYNRGFRSQQARTRRKNKRSSTQKQNRENIRRWKQEAPKGDWLRLATEARRLLANPPKQAFKGEHGRKNREDPQKTKQTRASIIRNTMDKQPNRIESRCPGLTL